MGSDRFFQQPTLVHELHIDCWYYAAPWIAVGETCFFVLHMVYYFYPIPHSRLSWVKKSDHVDMIISIGRCHRHMTLRPSWRKGRINPVVFIGKMFFLGRFGWVSILCLSPCDLDSSSVQQSYLLGTRLLLLIFVIFQLFMDKFSKSSLAYVSQVMLYIPNELVWYVLP